MNRMSLNLTVLCSLLFFLVLQSCKRTESEKPQPLRDYSFSGKITSTDGAPLRDAKVFINGKEYETNGDGTFDIKADSNSRFVVTIKKRGYGLLSKVFHNSIRDYSYRLTPAFVTRINPTKTNTIRDLGSSTRCVGSGFQNIQFDSAYKKIPFVYSADGKLVDFGWPANMKDLFEFASSPTCNPGATVILPANSIVNANGQTVTDSVNVSITTIDLQSVDGMPGDYTYQDASGSGSMVSAGAVSIEVYSSSDESFNLRRETQEKVLLSIPVEPAMLKYNKKTPTSIPVFYYDEKDGYWKQELEQEAKLNIKTNAYEVLVSHFSSINMDYKMPNPTCFRLRQDPIAAPMISSFRLGMLSPSFGYKLSSTIGDEGSTDCFPRPDGTNLHLVYNAPSPGEWICAILTENSATPTASYGITIQQTPATSYSGTGYSTTCPCTSLTTSTSPPPDNCYDGGSSACDASLSGCQPFSSTCENLQIRLFPQDVILAGRVNGANVEAKWIFKSLPDGTSYNYSIEQAHYDGGAMADVVDNTTNGGPIVYNASSPIQSIPAFAKSSLATKIKITITPSAMPTLTSNPVDF